MPIITVGMLADLDEHIRKRLEAALTDAARSALPADYGTVTVIIEEARHGSGLRDEGKSAASTDPASLVMEYLSAMEARDLVRAAAFLHERFEMVFPGGVRMRSLGELVDWAAGRYRRVHKHYEGFDVSPAREGAVVYCFGTLSGEWPDGEPFRDIRFVDRFELGGGLIRRQQVWNDLAEIRGRA